MSEKSVAALGRRFTTGGLVAAPLVGMGGVLLKLGLPESSAEELEWIAVHEGRFLAASFLLLVSFTLFVPALLGLMQIFRERGSTIGYVAAGSTMVGWLFHFALVGYAIAQHPMAVADTNRGGIAALADGMWDSPAFLLLLPLVLAPTMVGFLAVAICLWRARVAPTWVPLTLAAAQVADFVTPDAISGVPYFLLLAVALGWLGAHFGVVQSRPSSRSDEIGDVRVQGSPSPI